jgi:predicted  nucleic acid-binding Zn-ribbon protein
LSAAAGSMPTVEVSWGELIDKLTILEIKEQRLSAPAAVANVRKELAALRSVVQGLQPRPAGLDDLKAKLKSTNEMLWDIEDRIRAKEAAQSFDKQFIELARSVYMNNDHRARLKHEVNVLMKSELIEEKQYTPYAPR